MNTRGRLLRRSVALNGRIWRTPKKRERLAGVQRSVEHVCGVRIEQRAEAWP
jgi:hypothetical protein